MKPYITLFLLSSIDGKISTGLDSSCDFDNDIPNMPYSSNGLYHYYDAEKETCIWSINSGKVMKKMYDQKIGSKNKIANDSAITVSIGVNFIIFDNSHLTEDCILWLCKRAYPKKCIILSSKENKLVLDILNKKNEKSDWQDFSNLTYYRYNSLSDAMDFLYKEGCVEATLQTGSIINAEFFKNKLIDSVDIVIAPFIVGKNATNMVSDLPLVQEFELNSVENLGDGYVKMKYNTIK